MARKNIRYKTQKIDSEVLKVKRILGNDVLIILGNRHHPPPHIVTIKKVPRSQEYDQGRTDFFDNEE